MGSVGPPTADQETHQYGDSSRLALRSTRESRLTVAVQELCDGLHVSEKGRRDDSELGLVASLPVPPH